MALTERQLHLIVRIQSRFRGMYARKQVQVLKLTVKAGGPGMEKLRSAAPGTVSDYNNPNVKSKR